MLRAAQKLAQQTPPKEEQILGSTVDNTDSQAAVVVGNMIKNDDVSRAANKEDEH